MLIHRTLSNSLYISLFLHFHYNFIFSLQCDTAWSSTSCNCGVKYQPWVAFNKHTVHRDFCNDLYQNKQDMSNKTSCTNGIFPGISQKSQAKHWQFPMMTLFSRMGDAGQNHFTSSQSMVSYCFILVTAIKDVRCLLFWSAFCLQKRMVVTKANIKNTSHSQISCCLPWLLRILS